MSGSALYEDIYNRILSDIQNGKYPENMPLPAERQLCGIYHVSRSTVRQALQLLKGSETVYSIQGTGTFVRPHIFTQPLSKFYSFTDTLKSSNVIIQNKIIDYDVIGADAQLAKKTAHPEGTLLHKLTRLRSAEEYPLMIEVTYLPKNRFVKLDLGVLGTGSLYEFLRSRYSYQADRATETFRSVMPTSDEKELLQIPANTPCILLERFNYEENLLIEYTKSIVRGDKYVFHVELNNI